MTRCGGSRRTACAFRSGYEVRAGSDYVVGCRMLGDETIEGGGRIEDGSHHAAALPAGMSYISVSRAESSRTRSSPMSAGRLSVHQAERIQYMPTVYSDARDPETWRFRRPSVARSAGAASDSCPPAASARSSSRSRSEERRSRHRRRCAQSLADPDWFRKIRLGREGASLRVHELLRGPRPEAQGSDLQALGPRGTRRKLIASVNRRRRLVAPDWR
jgi:hypothetical protein